MGRSAEADHLLLGGLVLAIAGVWIAVPLLALLGGRPALPDVGALGSGILWRSASRSCCGRSTSCCAGRP